MADPFTYATSAPFTELDADNLNLQRQAGAQSVLVNGWWRGVDSAGLPAWWDKYTTGGGVVAGTTVAGEWATCGQGVKMSGGTAEFYQDVFGLLQEGWQGREVVLKIHGKSTTAAWSALIDYGTGGVSDTLTGTIGGEFASESIRVTVPATADKMLVVLRWTSATGAAYIDRVQLTIGPVDCGWMVDSVRPVVFAEGVIDDNAGTWRDESHFRLAAWNLSTSGSISGSASVAVTEDWTGGTDYWPTGWGRVGASGDYAACLVCYATDEANGNYHRVGAPSGNFGAVDGKPVATVWTPSVATLPSNDDIQMFALAWIVPRGPDPPERRQYPLD